MELVADADGAELPCVKKVAGTSTPKEGSIVPKKRKPGPLSSRRDTEKSQDSRPSSASSTASAAAGEAGGDCVMIGSSDEDAELTDEDFKTPPTKTPLRGLPKLETRGHHPKDPVPRLRKKEENKLRGEGRKLRAEKEKAEERERLLVDLGELIRGGGIWEEVRTPTRAPPPAVNLPLVEVETQMAEKDSAVVAEALARHAEVVDGVAYVATNLTGVAKRQLRLAALVVKAGIKILSGRMGGFAVSPDQREMEALTRKVERLEKEGQEKDRRIVELEQRCDELRDLATMEMSLDRFR